MFNKGAHKKSAPNNFTIVDCQLVLEKMEGSQGAKVMCWSSSRQSLLRIVLTYGPFYENEEHNFFWKVSNRLKIGIVHEC